jgi:uncharacterized repeat protein (TIGR02543 family)
MQKRLLWGALVATVVGALFACNMFDSSLFPYPGPYSVTYNSNGATGGTPPTDITSYPFGRTVTVLGNDGNMVKTGFAFTVWNTHVDGGGTSYAPGNTFPMGDGKVTLYAQWTNSSSSAHTVTYSGNGNTGGTVPTDSNNYLQGATVTVLGNTGTLVRTAYTFAGWNTQANGSGTSYAGGATFPMGTANVTLYALWTQNPTYTVTYNANGATGGSAPTDSNNYLQGATVTVLGNTGSLVKTVYTFAGWNTQANGSGTTYSGGAIFPMSSSNVTLYALWTIPTYTATYNANGATGGSVPTDGNSYLQGAIVTLLGNTGTLLKTGFAFAGWNTKPDGSGTSYAAGATFSMGTANVSLYVVWIPGNLTFTSSGTSITITGFATPPSGSLTIPGGVTSIGSNAFQNCTSLTSVIIPSSVTSIGQYAFYNSGLTGSVVIPSSVTSIGQNPFYFCANLVSIIVDPANLNYESVSGVLFNKTGTTLFEAPAGMTGSYTVPSSVTSIAESSFTSDGNGGGGGAGSGAFEGCSKLTSIIIPSSVTTVGNDVFAYCTSLVSVTIPASVTSIGAAAFCGCSSLLGVTIPASVTSIVMSAFNGCTSLASITIPASVTRIDDFAFENCTNLTSVFVQATTPPVLASGSSAFSACAAGLQIHVPSVPASTLSTYKAATGWSDYASQIVSP